MLGVLMSADNTAVHFYTTLFPGSFWFPLALKSLHLFTLKFNILIQ